MRWFVALVTAACLWAAGGARSDELQLRDRQPAQLSHVGSGLAHLVTGRDGSRGELRLSAFTVPAATIPEPPPRVIADGEATIATTIDGLGPVAPRARGPPRG